MASTAFCALALLTVVPGLAWGYSFEITAPPTQCGLLSLSLTQGSGKPPYTATVMPYGASVGNTEQRRVFQHQFSGSSTSFPLSYPANSNFIIMVGDSDGPGSGGTSVATSVGPSKNDTCLPPSVSALFAFEILPTTAINQCTPVTLAWNSSAINPVSIILAIPGGRSQNVGISNVGPQQGSTNGFQWTPNVRAGTNIVLVAGDARGIGTGGSVNAIVGFSTSNDQSCIDGNSPSSTAGTPAGVQTSTPSSGSHSGNGGNTNAGAIAGGVVGGIVAVLIGILLTWFVLRRRRISRHPAAHSVDLLTARDQEPQDAYHPEPYQPDPYILPPPSQMGQSSEDMVTPTHPSLSIDQRYSVISTTDASEMGHTGLRGGSTSYAPSSNRSRKSPGGPPQLRPVNVVQHEDAGEFEEGPSQPPDTVELPPSYTSVRK